MIEIIINYFSELMNESLVQLGINEQLVNDIVISILILVILIISWIIYKIIQGPIIKILENLTSITNTNWDNVLIEKRVFQRLLNFIPLIIIYVLVSLILEDSNILMFVQFMLNMLFIINGMMVVQSFLNFIL